MDLYILPMSCSLAAHIAAREAELPITLHPVDRATKRLDDGSDYRAIAPLPNVPALRLDDGTVVTEMAAVMQWIADHAPEPRLAPAWGSPARYELITWLHFVSTELHKKHLWMIFSAETPPEVKGWARADASAPLAHAAARLATRPYLLGDAFTVADAYLFWALLVLPPGGVPLDRWPALEAYVARIRARPSVAAALAIELPMFQQQRRATAAA